MAAFEEKAGETAWYIWNVLLILAGLGATIVCYRPDPLEPESEPEPSRTSSPAEHEARRFLTEHWWLTA